jgi:uncharacterized protein (DUF1697 family)
MCYTSVLKTAINSKMKGTNMHKELIARLRVGVASGRVVLSSFASLADEAADAIEALEEVSNQHQETVLRQTSRISELLDEKAVLEDKLKQEKETNLSQYNQLMKALSEKVTLWDEVERLELLQFRQAPCRRFCESTAYEIHIKQLKAACKVALEAIIPVSSYGRIGTKDKEQAALQTAITKLQGALQ